VYAYVVHTLWNIVFHIHIFVFVIGKGTQDVPSVVLAELELLQVYMLHITTHYYHQFYYRLFFVSLPCIRRWQFSLTNISTITWRCSPQ